jgi:hypothetical protein
MIERYIPHFFNILYHADVLQAMRLEEVRDAFHTNQIVSKNQAIAAFSSLPAADRNVLYIGSWIGFLTHYICDNYPRCTVTELDIDVRCKLISQRFNEQFTNYITSYTSDVECFGYFENYDTVINLSCEHIASNWIDKLQKGTTVVLQTNNFEIPEHVNTCKTLDEMREKYQLSETYYADATVLNAYTRFTLAGKR